MTVTSGIGTTVVFASVKGQSAFWVRGYDTPLIVLRTSYSSYSIG
ncbi:MAG: hypothetical protein ACRC8Y_17865 [Chroococcales cyanobacterium]